MLHIFKSNTNCSIKLFWSLKYHSITQENPTMSFSKHDLILTTSKLWKTTLWKVQEDKDRISYKVNMTLINKFLIIYYTYTKVSEDVYNIKISRAFKFYVFQNLWGFTILFNAVTHTNLYVQLYVWSSEIEDWPSTSLVTLTICLTYSVYCLTGMIHIKDHCKLF